MQNARGAYEPSSARGRGAITTPALQPICLLSLERANIAAPRADVISSVSAAGSIRRRSTRFRRTARRKQASHVEDSVRLTGHAREQQETTHLLAHCR